MLLAVASGLLLYFMGSELAVGSVGNGLDDYVGHESYDGCCKCDNLYEILHFMGIR